MDGRHVIGYEHYNDIIAWKTIAGTGAVNILLRRSYRWYALENVLFVWVFFRVWALVP